MNLRRRRASIAVVFVALVIAAMFWLAKNAANRPESPVETMPETRRTTDIEPAPAGATEGRVARVDYRDDDSQSRPASAPTTRPTASLIVVASDFEGEFVADVDVEVQSTSGLRAARSDANGIARLDGLPVGLVDIGATHPKFAAGAIRGLILGPGLNGPIDLHLVRRCEVKVHVTLDAADAAGISVHMAPHGDRAEMVMGPAWSPASSVRAAHGTTDTKGIALFTDVIPGALGVQACAPGAIGVMRIVRPSPGEALTIEVELRSVPSLECHVVDAATEAPIPDVPISVLIDTKEKSNERFLNTIVVSDAAGLAAIPYIPGKALSLMVEGPVGYGQALVEFCDGAPVTLRVKARRDVWVRVLDHEAQTVSEGVFWIRNVELEPQAIRSSAVDGLHLVRQLHQTEGEYRFCAMDGGASDLFELRRPQANSGGREDPFDLRLRPARRVVVQAIDSAGAPVPFARIFAKVKYVEPGLHSLFAWMRSWSFETVADENGAATVAIDEQMVVTLSAEASGGRFGERVLRPGSVAAVDVVPIQLVASHSIEVFVRLSGAPAVAMLIYLQRLEGESPTVLTGYTDRNGRLGIPSVPSGTYRVICVGHEYRPRFGKLPMSMGAPTLTIDREGSYQVELK